MPPELTLEKALIFRIVHRDNIPWILDNGLHCNNSKVRDPNFVEIGNKELISKRAKHPIVSQPGGMLSDYIPFYFTPFSPMLYNIKTGWAAFDREIMMRSLSWFHRYEDCRRKRSRSCSRIDMLTL